MSMFFRGVGTGGTCPLIRVLISPKFNEAAIPLPCAPENGVGRLAPPTRLNSTKGYLYLDRCHGCLAA